MYTFHKKSRTKTNLYHMSKLKTLLISCSNSTLLAKSHQVAVSSNLHFTPSTPSIYFQTMPIVQQRFTENFIFPRNSVSLVVYTMHRREYNTAETKDTRLYCAISRRRSRNQAPSDSLGIESAVLPIYSLSRIYT